jgi:hypothetical protein
MHPSSLQALIRKMHPPLPFSHILYHDPHHKGFQRDACRAKTVEKAVAGNLGIGFFSLKK